MLRTATAAALRAAPRRAASTVAAEAVAAAPAAAAPSTVSRTALADIPARWTAMAQPERSAVVESLLAAQKGDWKALSADQKKALYYIAYGPHGPREKLPKGFQIRVFAATMGVVAASAGLFWWIRTLGGQGVPTTTKEWQEASNEYAKGMNGNPYTGVASDNYKGSGHVAQA
ncbi:Cytochrome c oxidase subunit 5B, mitochondrial [Blastocladiella emersonii ATCC 22665]|nr:Cytochrome c oxidase subunit 5B, mitochondrial [Blastocladiella emersonii ATCC 22665]